ncbi:Uncharacterised protein [Legionella birminghamensis]|uniref:Uncharacterized protein n=1 Tax=Legionella birminghamensis TaxID=28083 RepID=A0A378ID15_9GAMM|nr:Uncharacterised protein [Legionella birminghamensis]
MELNSAIGLIEATTSVAGSRVIVKSGVCPLGGHSV